MIVQVVKYGSVYRFVGFKSSPYHNAKSDVYVPENNDVDVSEEERIGRFGNNVYRAKATVRELALCNPWEYFVTITIDERNQSRSDLGLFKKRLNQCFKDFNRKYGSHCRYLLIPELHADHTNWHCHGLLLGVPDAAIEVNSNGYADLPYFRKRFGWVSLDKIRDLQRCATYITKYVTKSMAWLSSSDNDLDIMSTLSAGEHLFFSSQKLQRKERLFSCDISNVPWTFENDYVKLFESRRPLAELLHEFGAPDIVIDAVRNEQR